jgi:hypothetical protein
VPRYGQDDSFDLENCIRSGFVCRIEDISPYMKKVALQFAEPLSFKPGEQEEKQSAVKHKPVEV